jgi:adenylyltransferase/sulfurtransferase
MAGTGNPLPEMTAEQLKQRLDTGEPLTLIDVREPFEWEIANLADHGARLIPLADVPDRMSELDPSDEIVLYCRSGGRSAGAARFLIANGFERVWNLSGGINGWAQQVDTNLPTY